MKKNKTLIMVLLFFMGLLILLYPSISDFYNEKRQSKVIVDYESLLKKLENEDYKELFKEADEYNQKLASSKYPFIYYKKIDNYNKILNVNSDGMIGYISIDKIKVELPIYHGTSEQVLSVAAGHLEGSSLPVGGTGTHAVLSAHRGLPTSKLFTDLDKLEIGDTFTVTVLDRLMTYQIDQIEIVEPADIEKLKINPNQDYLTLMTCTPYGINSHRMLVRGKRIENLKAKTYVTTEAFRISTLVVTPMVAIPIVLIILIIIIIKPVEDNFDKVKEMYIYPSKFKVRGIKNDKEN
jgi:sortase A